MKILLISANTVKTPYPVYPLGLDYVAGAIGESRDVRVLDMNDPVEQESLKETLIHYAPDAVGVSLRNIDSSEQSDKEGFFGAYLKLIKSIRKHTRAPVVLGGSGFSLFPDELMEAPGGGLRYRGGRRKTARVVTGYRGRRYGPFQSRNLEEGLQGDHPTPLGKTSKKGFPAPKTLQRILYQKRRDAQSADQTGVQLSLHLLHLSAHRGKSSSVHSSRGSGRYRHAPSGKRRKISLHHRFGL